MNYILKRSFGIIHQLLLEQAMGKVLKLEHPAKDYTVIRWLNVWLNSCNFQRQSRCGHSLQWTETTSPAETTKKCMETTSALTDNCSTSSTTDSEDVLNEITSFGLLLVFTLI